MKTRVAIIRLAVLLLVLATLAVSVAVFGVEAMEDWLNGAAESSWGPFAFVALYFLLVVIMLPGSLGTLAAGAVFGVWGGFGVAMAGAALGACAAFWIARTVGREGALAVIEGRAEVIDQALEDRGLLAVTILRLLPIVPFNALNYAAGLSALKFRDYAIGTVVGMAPGTFVVANVADQADNPMSPGFVAAIATAVAMVVASLFATRRLRSAIGAP